MPVRWWHDMRPNKIFFIKLVHSIIFLFVSACLGYILYCAVTRTYNWYLVFAIGTFPIEGSILIINKWQCPLTNLAKKYGDKDGSVTQYFCPRWFVPHVFQTYGVLLCISLILLVVNYF